MKERLKEIREQNKETQKTLAIALNTSQQQVNRYETGITKDINMRYLIAFCKHYHVSADYILGLSDKK